jgi:hypothetical protein
MKPVKLSPNHKKYVRNLLRTEGYVCHCGAKEVTIADKVFKIRGAERYFVAYACVNPECHTQTWRPFDGPVP